MVVGVSVSTLIADSITISTTHYTKRTGHHSHWWNIHMRQEQHTHTYIIYTHRLTLIPTHQSDSHNAHDTSITQQYKHAERCGREVYSLRAPALQHIVVGVSGSTLIADSITISTTYYTKRTGHHY